MLNRNLLPKTVNNYLDYLEGIKKKSDKTIDAYGSDLHIFLAYIKQLKSKKEISTDDELTKVDISNIKENFYKTINLDEMDSFLMYLNNRGNANSSINRRIATIKSFYSYLFRKKIISNNISNELESLEIPYRETEYLKVEEMNQVLNTIKKEDDRYTTRNYSLILLLMNTGLRNSEARNIKIKDIDWNDQILTVIGKGNKQRKVYLDTPVILAIKEWLKERDDIKIKPDFEEYLFVTQQGKILNIDYLNKIVKKYVDDAKLDSDIHTHSLRHSALTAVLKKTKNPKLVQQMAGHKSVSTTLNIYAHVDLEDIKDGMSGLGIE